MHKIEISIFTNDEPSIDDINDLLIIADQCPLKGGEEVYGARGILESYINFREYNDHDLCQAVEGRQFKKSSEIKVNPNPSSGIFTIQSPEMISSIEVFSLQGQKIFTEQGFLNGYYELNGNHLTPGIYLLKVRCGHNTYMSKLMKIE